MKNGGDTNTHWDTDIATYRLNWPRGQCSENAVLEFYKNVPN